MPGSDRQSASASAEAPHRELTVEALPVAGGVTPQTVLDRAARSWQEQGAQAAGQLTATLFGVAAVGVTADGVSDRDARRRLARAAWAAEAAGKVWVLTAGIEHDGPATGGIWAALTGIELASAPSPGIQSVGARRAAAVSVPMAPADPQPYAALPGPGWWQGDCDDGGFSAALGGIHSYRLGAVFRGVPACGPRPWFGGYRDPLITFFPGAIGEFEWECVELSMRFMYLAYGIQPYLANGWEVVRNYSGSRLIHVVNGTAGSAPSAGDVIAFAATAGNPYGHTAVVIDAQIDQSGNGSLGIMEQNASPTGYERLTVSNWTVYGWAPVRGWLHDPLAPTSAAYHGVSPARILDTRAASQVGPYSSPLAAGQTISLAVAGTGGVPALGVSAVALNLTVTGASGPGFLTVWPSAADRPTASTVNWTAGQTVANLAIARLGGDGGIQIYAYGSGVDVVIDVLGWYSLDPPGTGAVLNPMSPGRLIDTRWPAPPPNPPGTAVPVTTQRQLIPTLNPQQAVDVQVAGQLGIPDGATSVLVNLTVTGASSPGYLTIWPSGGPRPVASSINWAAGQTVANLVIASLGQNGRLSVFNSAGRADVVMDVLGWYGLGRSGQGDAGRLFAVSPTRIVDSRPSSRLGTFAGPLGPDSVLRVRVTGFAGIPAGASAVILNLTATDTSAAGFLTVWPDAAPKPVASNLNWRPGQTVANVVVAKPGPDGTVQIYNYAGRVNVVIDVLGWAA